MKYRIERATTEHLEKVMELWLKLMEEHKKYDSVFFAEVDKNKDYYFNDLKDYVTNTSRKVLLILYINETIVGYLTAEITDRNGYYNSQEYCIIGDIIIEDSFRKKGFGKALIAKVKIWCKEKNVKRIELNVFAENNSGHEFFKQIGFQDSFHTMCLSQDNM